MFLYRDREASRVWTGSRVLGSGCEVRAAQARGRGQNKPGFKKVGGRRHERQPPSRKRSPSTSNLCLPGPGLNLPQLCSEVDVVNKLRMGQVGGGDIQEVGGGAGRIPRTLRGPAFSITRSRGVWGVRSGHFCPVKAQL